MSGPRIIVSHDEDPQEFRNEYGAVFRSTLGVHAEITYPVGSTQAALEAVDRLAAGLRQQIADAAEGVGPR